MSAWLAGLACSVALVVLLAGRLHRRLRDVATTRRIGRRRALDRWLFVRIRTIMDRGRRTRPQVSATSLANLLDDIGRRCGSGESIATGFIDAVAASSIADSFAPAVDAISRGATIDESLAAVPTTTSEQRLAVHVLHLCAAQGGAITESLDRAAATLRERDAFAAERRAQAAQARLSAHVLTFIPLGFAVWTLSTSPTVARFLATPIGLCCVGLGVSLNIAGWWLMNRAIEVRT